MLYTNNRVRQGQLQPIVAETATGHLVFHSQVPNSTPRTVSRTVSLLDTVRILCGSTTTTKPAPK